MGWLSSIKLRLVALHVIAVLAVAVVLPLALYWRIDATARDLHERALREQAEQIAQYLHPTQDGKWTLDLPGNLRELYSAGYGRYGFAILTQAGDVLFTSRDHGEPLFRADTRQDRPTYFERDVGKARFFGASVPTRIESTTVWIQISQDQAHRDVLIDDIVAEFLPHVAWVIMPILLVLLGIDFLIFRGVLRPLEAASMLARQIGPTRTDLRLPEGRMPREVAPLVRAVNEALDRLERGFLIQREFLADAAHELRTPLAILRAEVEALGEREATRELLADVDSMARIVSQLIDIAESDALVIKVGDRADLRSICTEVVEFMAPVAVAQGKSIAVVGTTEPVWVAGSGSALYRAVRNLVENAITHTAPGTTVEVAVGTNGSVVVSDEGSGVALDQRELIFQRFWRGERQHSGSTGLGLAIVSRIVKAHGGRIDVRDRPVRGAAFSISLRQADMAPGE